MLTIRKTRVFPGPSLWAPVPAIVLEVDIGELEDVLRTQTPVFFERLVALVPLLHDYSAVVNQPEGGLKRLLLDRLALALQNLTETHLVHQPRPHLVRPELTYAQTLPTDEYGVYKVVFAYEHEEVGLAAGKLAVRLLNQLLVKSEPDVDFTRQLEVSLLPLAKRYAYLWTTGAVVAAAERRGIPVLRLERGVGFTGKMVQLGNGCYQRRILSGSITSTTPSLADKIATDKGLTCRLLREAGLPVPDHIVVRSVADAVKGARRIGYPVVVKPLDASKGRGLTLDVRDEAHVREAFPLAQRHSRSGPIVVERFIPGRYYRILVVGNQIVAVVEVTPAHVIGDGLHTIATLVEITNADPRRGDDSTVLRPITIDAHTRTVLAKQGLSLDDVPEAGRLVQLKQFGIYTLGGTYTDRTDEIHPDNVEIARQAAMVVGLDVAGIDFITADIARSAHDLGGAIIEVNQQPGLRVHIQPAVGMPRDVGMAIIDHLFPPGQPFRVPIVAITGTNGKTTTTRMIAHIMKTAGKQVGMTTTDGISIDGTQIAAGDRAGASSARKVLRNPAIDYAVLETARGSILRSGLGFDCCDVAVVTNVDADHLGQDGITTLADLTKVKAVVPGAVHPEGASVLNADCEWTVRIAETARGEIIYFAMEAENPVIAQHLRGGGRAVVLRQTDAGEMLTLLAGQEATEILLAEEIPATMEGRIRVNIANALAASAAALAQQVPPETIRVALRSFANSVAQTPGRFNLLEIDGRTVLIDYCHNVRGLEALADVVQRMEAPHNVAVIAMPGDRTDEHIAAFGQLAAQIFDELVIWETPRRYRRGRQRGEVPALLQAGALAGGLAADKLSHTDDDQEAARMAIAKGRKASLVALLVGSGRGLLPPIPGSS